MHLDNIGIVKCRRGSERPAFIEIGPNVAVVAFGPSSKFFFFISLFFLDSN